MDHVREALVGGALPELLAALAVAGAAGLIAGLAARAVRLGAGRLGRSAPVPVPVPVPVRTR